MNVTQQGIILVGQFCTKYPFLVKQFDVFRGYLGGRVSDDDLRDNLRFIKGSILSQNPEYADSLTRDLGIVVSYFEGRLRGKSLQIASGTTPQKGKLSGKLLAGNARNKPIEPELARFTLPQQEDNLTSEQKAIRIRQHEEYLKQVVVPLVKSYKASFAQVLSGGVNALHAGDDSSSYLDSKKIRKKYAAPVNVKIKVSGFAFAYYTKRDLIWLAKEYPTEFYKFYLSCRITNDSQYAASQQFLDELLAACYNNRISIRSKLEDHNYDSFNIYTWDRDQMAEILRKLYGKYRIIFNPVYHFFQGHIDGVSPTHIGWVQEPVGGVKGNSHSTRMGILGKGLDSGLNFAQSCKIAYVKPESPWLIDFT